MSGQLRFLLAGNQGPEVPVDPKSDLDTIELQADHTQSYAVFAAAVLTAGRRRGIMSPPELLSTPPSAAPPSAPPAPLAAVAPQLATPPPALLDQPAKSASGGDLAAASNPSWRERRTERRALKQHSAAVATWLAEQTVLERLTRSAHRAIGRGGGVDAGIMLKAGEVALWTDAASLVEPRRQPGQYIGGSSSVSFPLMPGVRARVGGSRGRYVPGPEVQTPVDRGRAVITTHRVVFTGGRSNREWAYSKLISMDSSRDDATVLISVSNRQKVSGLHLGKVGAEFTRFLALGVAIAQYGAAQVAAECQAAANKHRDLQPQFQLAID